jgi:hypothetical protein
MSLLAITFIIYIIMSVMVGMAGTRTAIGFSGSFLLSIILTPFLISFILLITIPGRHD